MNINNDPNPFMVDNPDVVKFRTNLLKIAEEIEIKQPEGFREVISAAFKGLGDKLHEFFYYITHFASVPDFKLTKLDMNRAHLEEKKDHVVKEFRDELERAKIDIKFLKSQGIDPEEFVRNMFMPAIKNLIEFEREFEEGGTPIKNKDLVADIAKIREFETAFKTHRINGEKATGTALLKLRKVLGEKYNSLSLHLQAARETVDESIAAESRLTPHTHDYLALRKQNDTLSADYQNKVDLVDKYNDIIDKINEKLGINEDDLNTEMDNLDLLEMIDDE